MIIKNNREQYIEAHPEGTYDAVIVDVTPLVERETQYGRKEEFKIIFESDLGKIVKSRLFTPSLHEKSAFYKFLRQFHGRQLSERELSEYDTEGLVGKTARITVGIVETEKGAKFANILMCKPTEATVKATGNYTRVGFAANTIDPANYRN